MQVRKFDNDIKCCDSLGNLIEAMLCNMYDQTSETATSTCFTINYIFYYKVFVYDAYNVLYHFMVLIINNT